MKREDANYQSFVTILKEELKPAMGCTEPIAIAYGAAKAREVLGAIPDRVVMEVSGNIIKNVKSVIVPHTGGLRGIPAAASAGIIAGDAGKELQVISEVTQEQVREMAVYLEKAQIEVCYADTKHIFDIGIHAYKDGHHSYVRIIDYHTNLVRVEKDGEVLFEKKETKTCHASDTCHDCLCIAEIVDFADTVAVEDVEEVLSRQVAYNMAISEEGLKHSYGANVGKVLMRHYPDDVKIRARAAAAAGSDARMNGCELPVIINSGSGNQGMTASIPVIVYARELNASEEELYRALIVSNLVTIHLKTGIGRLSAYCGAISAGAGCGAGIAYLNGGRYEAVSHTLVNALAMISGTICDGAKASCAAKIASAVDAGILGYYMYVEGQEFCGGDGIVLKGVENTICNVGKLASIGMSGTDREIIKLMVGEETEEL